MKTEIETKGTILVVDDDEILSLILTRFLTNQGYSVITSDCATEALHSCKTLVPDLILMDAVMPDMNGFECTKELKHRFPDSKVPIYIVTGLEENEIEEKVASAGATGFIHKPIDWSQLQALLTKHFS